MKYFIIPIFVLLSFTAYSEPANNQLTEDSQVKIELQAFMSALKEVSMPIAEVSEDIISYCNNITSGQLKEIMKNSGAYAYLLSLKTTSVDDNMYKNLMGKKIKEINCNGGADITAIEVKH